MHVSFAGKAGGERDRVQQRPVRTFRFPAPVFDLRTVRGARGKRDLNITGVGLALVHTFNDVVLLSERELGTRFDRDGLGVQQTGHGDRFAFGIGFEVRHLSFFVARLGNLRGLVP